jgi:hypothetical protein
VTQIRKKNGKEENLGTSMLCKTFTSFEKAIDAGERNLLFPTSNFYIKEYDDTQKVMLFGENDNGKIIYKATKEHNVLLCDRTMPEEKSSLGVNYGCELPKYGGTVINAALLPDGAYFYVENGCWWGLITSENNIRYIYAGVDPNEENPTTCGNYIQKIKLEDGETYDVAVGKIKVKQYIECKKVKWMELDVSDILDNTITTSNELEVSNS